jgi:putative ABC transport system permease protein
MYAFRLLVQNKQRFILTSLGIALCTLLMLFMVSLYESVADGCVEYVRTSKADLWVLQKHATNILRSTSLLPSSYETDLSNTEGVKSVSPIFFIFASVPIRGENATFYLTGFDPVTGVGGPPRILEGHTVTSDDEIVLDKAFAAKYKLEVGDRIPVKDDSLTVCGISGGTNMFVLQYAFISLHEAHNVVGFHFVVSAYQVKILPTFKVNDVQANVYAKLKNVVVFDNDTFVKNNIHEMENGIIPLFLIITLITAVVLTAILSLILSVSVLERRKDFAIIKALGSPHGFITGLVVLQSMLLSFTGLILGVVLFFPMISLIEKLSPEVANTTSLGQILLVSAGVLLISLISSILPIQKIRKIYPLEVFMS